MAGQHVCVCVCVCVCVFSVTRSVVGHNYHHRMVGLWKRIAGRKFFACSKQDSELARQFCLGLMHVYSPTVRVTTHIQTSTCHALFVHYAMRSVVVGDCHHPTVNSMR